MDWLTANLEVLENKDATEDEEDEEDDLQGPNEKRQKQQGTGPLRQASRLRRPLCGQGTHRLLLINKGLAMGQGLPKSLSNLRVLFYLDLHSGKSNLQVLLYLDLCSKQSILVRPLCEQCSRCPEYLSTFGICGGYKPGGSSNHGFFTRDCYSTASLWTGSMCQYECQ